MRQLGAGQEGELLLARPTPTLCGWGPPVLRNRARSGTASRARLWPPPPPRYWGQRLPRLPPPVPRMMALPLLT
eukprot:634459-Alexandrium_andersonii.AAC.1